MNRSIIFDEFRSIIGRGLTQTEVDRLDNAITLASTGGAATSGRTTGAKGLALIKSFEGLRLKSYPDPGTGGEPWTIGYGHTGGVKPGQVITEAQADEFLRADLARFEVAVNKLCPVTTQNQFDALVSFTFNVGENALKESTLRRLHNEGAYSQASDQFKRWDKAVGKVMAGLSRRRAAEAQLYRSAA